MKYALICFFLIPGMSQEESEPDQRFPIVGKYAASQILITWDGAKISPLSLNRSKNEAKKIAEEIASTLQIHPELFEELAETRSEDETSAENGGFIGGFGARDMVGAFSGEVKRLKVGQISPKPVKSEYGYHIIRRESLNPVHYSASLFLISYKGAETLKNIPRDRTGNRTKDEARALIEKIHGTITPANFEEIHQEFSDFKKDGGSLGVFSLGKGPLYRKFRQALQNTNIEGITPVFELPIGFAFLKRLRVEKFSGSQILICYAGCDFCPPRIARSRSEARTFAESLIAQIKNHESSFEELAKIYSDEPFGVRGGLLPDWFPGSQDPKVDRAIQELEIGQVCDQPVEVTRGFLILRRNAYQH